MKSVRLLLLVLVLLGPFPDLPADDAARSCHPPCAQTVFVVQRTKNENELCYQANLAADGFHQRVPLNVYWVMKTRGGAHEELTNMERNKAYGLKFLAIAPHEIRFSVKALEGVAFRAEEVSSDEGVRVVAYATVEGEEMAVEHVFISTKEGGLVPKVLYIEFSGTSAATHAPVVHRIVPKQA